ncbi:SEC-C metal-binding domain-containing protein [Clostridium ljungdahlii]|uniref:Plasmid pRiA4b Orf3-like domain-containing protein n=1 Tax=Clostridium ljungdahlii TaxID=1538 RepID=A0A162LAS7_9CLOT|nr:SEC-C metal-binding domain-containing protein [Clostridium ljungdahlii]OAA91096.1 hypothetical protein WY13_00926 [Clostridium ljungdahlii]
MLKGKCYYCNKEFSKAGILKHIKSCKVMKESMGLDESSSSSNINKFILGVYSKYDKDYWMYITIDINCTLKNLDQFLRDIWVECCGHLSMFEIYGERYESEIDTDWTFGEPSNDMNIKLKNVIGLNNKIEYEYDFGSTTYLEIKVIDKIICSNKGKDIELIARNNEPELKCSNCGSKASYYDYENEEYLCDDCFEDSTSDEEMIEEVDYVNSPRAGVCGYHGSKEDEVKYLPNVKSGKVITVGSFGSKTEEENNDVEEDYTYEDDEESYFDNAFSMDFDKVARRAINAGIRKEIKNWQPIEKNFSLEYHLNRFTKDKLIDIAKNLYINKISKLKKEELKNKILDSYEQEAQFIMENMGGEAFKVLLEASTKKICSVHNYDIETNVANYLRNRAFLFTGEIDGEDVIIVPEELQKVILRRDNKELIKQLEKNEEIIKLFWGMCNYYGVVELETFKELVKRYIDFDIAYMNLEVILENAAEYYGEFEFNGYLGNDVLVDDAFDIICHQREKRDLNFYPFKKEELLEAAKIDFQDKTKAYNKLYKFFTENFDIDSEDAEDLILALEAEFKNNVKISDVMEAFITNFDVSSIEEVNLIGNEVIKFFNNTRMWILKGYTPEELSSTTVIKKEKVGRNDPCPCGSGKKYKNCCGKK